MQTTQQLNETKTVVSCKSNLQTIDAVEQSESSNCSLNTISYEESYDEGRIDITALTDKELYDYFHNFDCKNDVYEDFEQHYKENIVNNKAVMRYKKYYILPPYELSKVIAYYFNFTGQSADYIDIRFAEEEEDILEEIGCKCCKKSNTHERKQISYIIINNRDLKLIEDGKFKNIFENTYFISLDYVDNLRLNKTDAATETTNSSAITAAKPAETTNSSAITAAKPAETAETANSSAITAAKPAKPAETANSSAITAAKPAETTTLPAETTNSSAITAAKPAETANSSAITAAKPAETTTLPAETTTLPAETTTLPAETTAKPAETTNSSAITVAETTNSSAINV